MSDYMCMICQDVLIQILKRLPIKTLLRCRCVCKSWKHLIDSKPFMVDHLHQALQTPRIMAQKIHESKYMAGSLSCLTLPPKNQEGPAQLLTLPSIQHSQPHLLVVGVIHGVICLYNNDDLLLLWNPSVRRHSRLPLPDIRHSNTLNDDLKCCGFWIDDTLSHFKIVILFPVHEKFAVFSSANQAWTEMVMESERIMEVGLAWSGHPQVLIDGVIYWKLISPFDVSVSVIAYFDFGRDKLGTVELPRGPRTDDVDHGSRVIKWRGGLAVTHWQKLFPFGCDLWAMQDGSWGKMFSFKLAEEMYDVWYVEDDYSRVLAKSKSGYFMLFDPNKDGRIHRLQSSVTMPRYVTWVCADFVESLVFPAQLSL